ncbi:MAG: hypothetical protein J7647_27505, partial [Cyanobacteria bacterium SBLK]|nr:hypothetical protein [Cyanobacteria bacterium SBLK]
PRRIMQDNSPQTRYDLEFAGLEPPEIPIEEMTDFVTTSKDLLACYCFRLLLSQGMTWEDIFRSITVRINNGFDNEGRSLIADLQDAAEKIDLTPDDFSRLGISPREFRSRFIVYNRDKFSPKTEEENS